MFSREQGLTFPFVPLTFNLAARRIFLGVARAGRGVCPLVSLKDFPVLHLESISWLEEMSAHPMGAEFIFGVKDSLVLS